MENLMMLTDKCGQDFHKWFIDKYDLFDDKDPIRKAMLQFYRLPHSMKFGVYVDFFIENDLQIYIKPTVNLRWSVYIDLFGRHILTEYYIHETHKEAKIKAIQKANELYNGKK